MPNHAEGGSRASFYRQLGAELRLFVKTKCNRQRPVVAVNGAYLFSPKADLGKKWGFANGWLRVQTRIHPPGPNADNHTVLGSVLT